MFSFFKKKYTEDENKYFEYIKNTLTASGMPENKVSSTARTILDGAIEKAEKAGLRGVKTIGNNAIKDKQFISKRLAAGLTTDDVLAFLNRDYVLIVVENMLIEAHRYSIYVTLTQEGKSPEEAVRFLRKTFVHFDDPEKSHKNYRNADADIYPEFTSRHEAWRNTVSIAEERELASHYSTYNAMVRDLVAQGTI